MDTCHGKILTTTSIMAVAQEDESTPGQGTGCPWFPLPSDQAVCSHVENSTTANSMEINTRLSLILIGGGLENDLVLPICRQ